MVVIDAEKHNLNWQQSAKDNNISALKNKYQKIDPNSKGTPGASTLISRSSSRKDVPLRRASRVAEGGPVDPITGKKQYTLKGDSYTIPAHTRTTASGKVVNVPEQVVVKTFKSKQMIETDDAFTLSSGQPIEIVYAQYANKLKALANEARKTDLMTKPIPYNLAARQTYDQQVRSLAAKLNIALKNAPLERQAQIVAGTILQAKKDANPDMDPSDMKKAKGQALVTARLRLNASKARVKITNDEWHAIQAGAISPNQLNKILANTDIDVVKQLATPRVATVMDSAKLARAQSMLKIGYTQSEVAAALGIPTSTLNSSLSVQMKGDINE
jgi:hypothetical protein